MTKITEINQQNIDLKTQSYAHTLETHSHSHNLINTLIADWKSVYKYDPAAKNWLEVFFCYPGLQALIFHRFAHWLHRFRLPFIPRFLSFVSRLITGIEIHPGAKIGKGVFIDHGMGVVIGETAIIGDYVLIYQGVTLGGTGKDQGKRHPTVGNHVLVGAGAKVLGNIYIGDHVRIGAGSVVLRDVPSHCTVVGIPGRITRTAKGSEDSLANETLPDPEAEVIRNLFERIKILENEINDLRQLSLTVIENNKNQLENNNSESNQIIEEFLHGAGI